MSLSLREGTETLFSLDLGSDGTKNRAMDRVYDFALSDEGDLAFVAAGLHLRCLDIQRLPETWRYLRSFELNSACELWRYRPANLFGFLQSSPRAVAYTRNRNVWVCNDNGSMDLFRPNGEQVSRWRANDTPNMVSRMGNGDWYVGSDGYGLTVWDPEDARRIQRIGSTARVYAIKAFPKEEKVAVRSDVGVTIVDLFSGHSVRSFPVLPGLPFIDVSPDARTLVVGEGRGAAVYSVDGEHLRHIKADGRRILSATFHPQNGSLWCGLDSGEVQEFA